MTNTPKPELEKVNQQQELSSLDEFERAIRLSGHPDAIRGGIQQVLRGLHDKLVVVANGHDPFEEDDEEQGEGYYDQVFRRVLFLNTHV